MQLGERHQLGARAFAELLIWRVPEPVRGSMTLADLAARLGRNPDEVAADAGALSAAGVLDREGERVTFPFARQRVAFELTKAA